MREMRRADRQLSVEEAYEILEKAPYVSVSMVRPDGTPYGLPLSLARVGESTFYFHCAIEGEKLDCLRANPIVSLSAVTRCQPKYQEQKGVFTALFRSAVALGKAEIVEDEAEKITGLRAICERFLPEYMDAFDGAISRSLSNTCVVRITLLEPPVGKAKLR